MIRAHELARKLLAGPNAVVALWDGEQDVDIEEAILVTGCGGVPVIVMGLEIRGPVLEDSETVWACDDDRAYELDVQRAKLLRERLERAGEARAEEAAQ